MTWTDAKIRRAPALQRRGLTLAEIAARLSVPRGDVVLFLFGGVRPKVPETKPDPAPGARVRPRRPKAVPPVPVKAPTPRRTDRPVRRKPPVAPPASLPVAGAPSAAPAPRVPEPAGGDAAAVAAFIARHGVRRFEPGASGDLQNLRYFLTERGYAVAFTANFRQANVQAPGQGQRMKMLSAAKFIDLCDRVRHAEGLEPLRPRMERPHPGPEGAEGAGPIEERQKA